MTHLPFVGPAAKTTTRVGLRLPGGGAGPEERGLCGGAGVAGLHRLAAGLAEISKGAQRRVRTRGSAAGRGRPRLPVPGGVLVRHAHVRYRYGNNLIPRGD